ncbi:hemolysin family protein [Paraflavitalea sp. CAU 1676]|uniref:hemolysin family protein n=1 Tax=Paraflavitalea sp. CAU 1676 TaxID=3032598 RepID=UPI0023DC1444|nr:hemolysin family protein [Paraflavitalea sp. CAU 1676]MDF2190796.1 hemolysin family protein [Paraflavitalea sp. CAU 1676]
MSLVVIIAIVLAFFFIAYFSGIEVAFTSANRLNIELKKKQGSASSLLLSSLFDNPSRFIGVNIVGYTFFLVVAVLLGSASWNKLIPFEMVNTPEAYLVPFRLFGEILLSWLAIVVFGEFIPKAIFRAKADSLLSFSARTGLLGLSDQMFNWASVGFVKISIFILNIIFDMRIDKKKPPFSRADLDLFESQNNEHHNQSQDLKAELFENALSLPKIKVRECLVPRKEIEAVDMKMTVEDVRKIFVDTKLSKLVVYDGDIDHILGYVHQLDLFKQPATIKDMLLPIPAIPESMSATDLISKFSKERKSIAWVVDEFGGTAGIVTMEDLLEEIFGEIKDEFDVEEFEDKRVSEDEFILSGRLELDFLREKYGLEFPDHDSETLSGFIIQQHETIPKLRERIIIGDYEFDVMGVSDTRIETVRLKILR